MALFWLSDTAWAAIEPHLPQNRPGAWRVDGRAGHGPSASNRWSGPGWLRLPSRWLKLPDALVEARTGLDAAAG